VLLGYVDDDGLAKYRALFAIYEGELRSEYPCDGYTFRGWCAHVALLWWRWSRDQLGVVDLDTGETYLSPPWWLNVDDAEAQVTLPAEGDFRTTVSRGQRGASGYASGGAAKKPRQPRAFGCPHRLHRRELRIRTRPATRPQ